MSGARIDFHRAPPVPAESWFESQPGEVIEWESTEVDMASDRKEWQSTEPNRFRAC